jgi:hypothetical protein
VNNTPLSAPLVSLSLPSKTFLVGEYAVLANYPCAIIATEPRFRLSVFMLPERNVACVYEGICLKGVLALLCHEISEKLQGYHFIFNDPHHGQGGFGASSAQYALLYYAYQKLLSHEVHITECLHQYRTHTKREKIRASGADLIGQLNGKLTLCCPADDYYEAPLEWPWPHLNATLFKTSYKIATHEHLSTLSDFPKNTLGQITKTSIEAIKIKDAGAFIKSIQMFSEALSEAALYCDETLRLLEEINRSPFVLAAKGCGALGADVILVLIENKNRAAFREWIQKLPLKYASDVQNLSRGLST